MFGTVVDVSFPGVGLDVDLIRSITVDNDNDDARWIDFNINAGLRGSAYEHIIPERMFNEGANLDGGVSSLKALGVASEAGQRIFAIDSTNVSAALGQVNLDPSVENEIASAAAGHLTILGIGLILVLLGILIVISGGALAAMPGELLPFLLISIGLHLAALALTDGFFFGSASVNQCATSLRSLPDRGTKMEFGYGWLIAGFGFYFLRQGLSRDNDGRRNRHALVAGFLYLGAASVASVLIDMSQSVETGKNVYLWSAIGVLLVAVGYHVAMSEGVSATRIAPLRDVRGIGARTLHLCLATASALCFLVFMVWTVQQVML